MLATLALRTQFEGKIFIKPLPKRKHAVPKQQRQSKATPFDELVELSIQRDRVVIRYFDLVVTFQMQINRTNSENRLGDTNVEGSSYMSNKTPAKPDLNLRFS